jgi:H+/gluconate symporter-like permease
MGIFGILLSLLLLMYLAYRGLSVIVLAPILALMAALVAGGMPLLATYTQVFMTAFGSFVVSYFPIFLLGSVFGQLMDVSGSAHRIADTLFKKFGKKHSILAVVLACGILTYGGVSVFVVVFAVFPLADAIFRAANIPKRLIPGAIGLGGFTFSMTAFPGSTAIHNAIPMPYFHTTPFAAPVLGILTGLMMLGLGMLWLNHRAAQAARAGEGFGHVDTSDMAAAQSEARRHAGPNFWLAMLPIVAVVCVSFVMAEIVIPRWNTSYLDSDLFKHGSLNALNGIWSLIVALAVGIALCVAINWKRINLNRELSQGAMGALLPTVNTASEVGYGATIAALAAFAIVKHFVLGISPQNPLVSEAVAVNLLAGITGSASGGMSIALQALGETYRSLGAQHHIPMAFLHRIAALASGGLDSLPHNGAVITLLTVCGLTHRQSYKDIGMVTLVIPVITTAVAVAVLSLMY